jgi:hypothetical protein
MTVTPAPSTIHMYSHNTVPLAYFPMQVRVFRFKFPSVLRSFELFVNIAMIFRYFFFSEFLLTILCVVVN